METGSRIRLKDIAAHCGCTVNTVSHALRGMQDISAPTRQRILSTAQQMGYVANSLASSLRSGQSWTVALIVSDLKDPYSAAMIEVAESSLRTAGYSSIMLCTQGDPTRVEDAIKVIVGQHADGVITFSRYDGAFFAQKFHGLHIPSISIGHGLSGPGAGICLDGEAGAHALTEYLIKTGHRKIVYLSGDDRVEAQRQRQAGFLRAAEQYALTPHDALCLPYTDYRHMQSTGSTEQIYDLHHPDGVIAFNAMMGRVVIDALQRRGLSIPKDLSVAGFDDINVASEYLSPLTSMSEGNHGIAQRAVARLIAWMEGATQAGVELLPMELSHPTATVRCRLNAHRAQANTPLADMRMMHRSDALHPPRCMRPLR